MKITSIKPLNHYKISRKDNYDPTAFKKLHNETKAKSWENIDVVAPDTFPKLWDKYPLEVFICDKTQSASKPPPTIWELVLNRLTIYEPTSLEEQSSEVTVGEHYQAFKDLILEKLTEIKDEKIREKTAEQIAEYMTISYITHLIYKEYLQSYKRLVMDKSQAIGGVENNLLEENGNIEDLDLDKLKESISQGLDKIRRELRNPKKLGLDGISKLVGSSTSIQPLEPYSFKIFTSAVLEKLVNENFGTKATQDVITLLWFSNWTYPERVFLQSISNKRGFLSSIFNKQRRAISLMSKFGAILLKGKEQETRKKVEFKDLFSFTPVQVVRAISGEIGLQQPETKVSVTVPNKIITVDPLGQNIVFGDAERNTKLEVAVAS